MNGIEELTSQHRACDEDLARSEDAVRRADWTVAQTAYTRFEHGMLLHFALEEDRLFPAFEAATGMTGGPTAVMRGEHAQMRQLFVDMGAALNTQDRSAYLGASETMLILMQQHNMKEENILYPMCRQHVQDLDALVCQAGR